MYIRLLCFAVTEQLDMNIKKIKKKCWKMEKLVLYPGLDLD